MMVTTTSHNANRYRIQLGLAVALVITLIGVFTAYGAADHTALALIGIGRFIYAFCIWLMYVPVSRLVKNKLVALVVFLILGTVAILPLISYNIWVDDITNSFYSPFEDPSGIKNKWEFLQWTYIWRGLLISLLIYIIQYREDLLQIKQLYLIANEKLQNQNLKHQLEVLKQQVDPHFLFNTLNALKTLIKKDPDKAEKYAIEISNVYRYLLRHNRNKTVLVKEELEFLNAYLSLLQLRFEGNLKVQVNIDSALYNKMIFPLSLQLLVENAVKHNIVTKDAPLEVYIYSGFDRTSIAVENKIQLRSATEGVSQYGLAHLNKLYKLHYNKEIEISDTAGIFKVSLPII